MGRSFDRLFDCLAPKNKTEKEPRRPTKQWSCETVTKKRNKARGKWRWHRLAIDRSMDRSTAKKEEKDGRLRLFDRLFDRLAPKNKTEKEPRGPMKQWPVATVTKKRNKAKGEWRRHRLAIDRSMDRSAAKKKRKKTACDRLFYFDRFCRKKKTEKEPRGSTKQWLVATVTKAGCDGHQKARGKWRRHQLVIHPKKWSTKRLCDR